MDITQLTDDDLKDSMSEEEWAENEAAVDDNGYPLSAEEAAARLEMLKAAVITAQPAPDEPDPDGPAAQEQETHPDGPEPLNGREAPRGPDHGMIQGKARSAASDYPVTEVDEIMDAYKPPSLKERHEELMRRSKQRQQEESSKPTDDTPGPKTTKPILPGTLNIAALSKEEYLARIEELRPWVPQLVVEFGLTDRIVPECWDKHIFVVTQLSALFNVWKSDFAPGQPAGVIFNFLRNLDHMVANLQKLVPNSPCSPGHHAQWIAPKWALKQIETTDRAWWLEHL